MDTLYLCFYLLFLVNEKQTKHIYILSKARNLFISLVYFLHMQISQNPSFTTVKPGIGTILDDL